MDITDQVITLEEKITSQLDPEIEYGLASRNQDINVCDQEISVDVAGVPVCVVARTMEEINESFNFHPFKSDGHGNYYAMMERFKVIQDVLTVTVEWKKYDC